MWIYKANPTQASADWLLSLTTRCLYIPTFTHSLTFISFSRTASRGAKDHWQTRSISTSSHFIHRNGNSEHFWYFLLNIKSWNQTWKIIYEILKSLEAVRKEAASVQESWHPNVWQSVGKIDVAWRTTALLVVSDNLWWCNPYTKHSEIHLA